MYPYFYFHGYTNHAVQQKWKMVVLENEYIKVFVCPEIGGKIWGAIEKSTGKEFLYYNDVVKFRDVAMRGAWTSGGLEYNFGDIGHIPTCATPVDYATMENEDGSVSCVVGAIDLPSGTKWNVEIKVSPGKAFFETKASWFNNTELPCTYYHWMNAAAKAGDDLEFIYPGKNWIGHGEETGNWPTDNNREINWYKNNNFGSYKSYHVMNSYSEFFGGYWHNEDFGFGHYGNFDEKPGKKLWIWGLAPEGMIWEDLMTDTDGQYIEYQAGKLFNQAANSSTLTPFKHKEFVPHDADIMNEIWFPLKGTKGMKAVSEYGVLNILKNERKQKVVLSALQPLNDQLYMYKNGDLLSSARIELKPLELFETSINVNPSDEIKIVLGDNKLSYSSNKNETLVDRPIYPNNNFNWDSAYGQFIKGLELEKQREYTRAKTHYEKALKEDPGFLPAINRLALSYYRQMDYKKALALIYKALSIDTYDGEANYLLGLICREGGNITLAKSGFSIAMGKVAFRSAAATELANLFLNEENRSKAEQYANKALAYNAYNLDALKILALSKRKSGDKERAKEVLKTIAELDGTNHFQKFETFLLSENLEDQKLFVSGISNELPHESYLDLAISYYEKGCKQEAIKVLELAPENPVVNLWLAHLKGTGRENYLDKVVSQSAQFVFPHRAQTAKLIESFLNTHSHWKLNYYLGLVYWNKGLLEKAVQQFELCENNPDFAAFYLAKVKLLESIEEKLQCAKMALELEPESWRAALEVANFYLKDNRALAAKRIIQPFLQTHPEQSAIGLCYAQCLSGEEKFEEAAYFLENYELLPFEGATVGRDLYNEVCIRSAARALNGGKYNKAIKLAQKAKKWPLNLGVGKPFDVDERIEDYILFLAYNAKGDKQKAKATALKITDYNHPDFKEENSSLFLQLMMLKRTNREEDAQLKLSGFLRKYPESRYLKWVEAKFRGASNVGDIEEAILGNSGTTMAYDTKFKDKRVELLLYLLIELNQ
ncbi:DUF5107 domain-containing protein [uncultured Sunxiuqinia sp.]|uniref:DUF5107 domain-containing protein n=1 Tax=uncultured Sunxiuqinia sp. TaxID=1573825 RepID=UPI0026227659|nr:DUF5107 domain-containing protein [uncultured Sunxiuqinia sp.]